MLRHVVVAEAASEAVYFGALPESFHVVFDHEWCLYMSAESEFECAMWREYRRFLSVCVLTSKLTN